MKTEIKVHFNNGELERQYNRETRIAKIKRDNIFHIGMSILLATVLVFTISIYNSPKVSANSVNEEYTYYWVDNYRDYARKIRLETCERVWKQILWEVTEEQIEHCGTINTIITAIESANMNSNRCTKDNNCKWLKGWQNGKYGFMKFDTKYEQNLYFAEKWFTYHYKKSIHTLVFGYKQKDWKYRYGWTYTQQNTYYTFVRSKYYGVLREIEKL